MPAAAVIPAPKAYIKIVAVKKLVVGLCLGRLVYPLGKYLAVLEQLMHIWYCTWLCGMICIDFTLRKSECSTQAHALYM